MELFDLERDPEERENLASARPLVVRYLRDQMASIEEAQSAVRVRLRAGATVELTPEEKERLRALGYVGN